MRPWLRNLILGAAPLAPSLAWDFTKATSLPAGSTFTRTTTATYIGPDKLLRLAAAGEARFDCDPITGRVRGLLLEEQRTNSAIRSDAFQTGWTTGSSVITANQALGPDGAMSADRFYNNAAANPQIYQSFSAVNATGYCDSVYAYRDPASAQPLDIIGEPQGTASIAKVWFAMSGAGTATLNTGAVVNKGIDKAGPDFFRMWDAWTATATGTGYQQWNLCDTDGTTISAPDTTSGAFIFGAQREVGAFPTSYIPTAAAAVTRNADVLKLALGAWFNATEGTLFIESELISTANTYAGLLSLNDNVGNEVIQMYAFGNQPRGEAYGSGASQALLGSATVAAGAKFRCALAYKANDFAFCLNGGTVLTDAAGVVPAVTQMNVGSINGATAVGNQRVSRMLYFPKRVSNNELKRLTT